MVDAWIPAQNEISPRRPPVRLHPDGSNNMRWVLPAISTIVSTFKNFRQNIGKLPVKVLLVDRFVFFLDPVPWHNPKLFYSQGKAFVCECCCSKFCLKFNNIESFNLDILCARSWMFLFSDKFVSRPYFGDTETVITVQQGEAAFFNCQVFNLANQTVRYHPQSSLFKTYSRPPEKWFTQHCLKRSSLFTISFRTKCWT